MLKIRLRRMGSRHRPFYRVVVSDIRQVPTAAALEEIGFYDPRKKPSFIKVDLERAEHWLERGARPSSTVRQLMRTVRKASLQPPAPETPEPAAEAETAPAPAAEAKAEASEDAAAAKAEASEDAAAAKAEASEDTEVKAEAAAPGDESPAEAKADAEDEAEEARSEA